VVQNSKAAQSENAALVAENESLRQAILKKSCFTCGGTMVPAELLAEDRPLLMENGKLRGEYMSATALLNQILLTAPPAKRPPVVAHVNEGASRADRTARLRMYLY
jgi:homeobox-leucine zipper protein